MFWPVTRPAVSKSAVNIPNGGPRRKGKMALQWLALAIARPGIIRDRMSGAVSCAPTGTQTGLTPNGGRDAFHPFHRVPDLLSVGLNQME